MTSRTSQERTEEALARIPNQESLVGVFVSQAGPLATVIQGATVLQVKTTSQVLVVAGDAVRLERRDGELIMLGPSAPRSAVGRISAAGSPQCTVETPVGSGLTKQMPFVSSYTPVVNDTVLLSWDPSGAAVIGKLSAVPGSTTPELPGGGAPVQYRQMFTAIDSGSFRFGSWWTGDLWSSDNNIAAWFYGTKIHDTIPDTAQIVGVSIYLPNIQSLYGSPTFALHGSDFRPGGAVVFGSSFGLEPRSGWVGIPTSFIDVLKGSAGGVGFNHGGYSIWNGVQKDGLSGALDITYRN